jgi:Transmembrane exosortase (Exosortase_EpsH)
MSQLATIEPVAGGICRPIRRAVVWWQAMILVILAIWLYHSVFIGMVLQWKEDPNFSHGFLVIPFSLLVVWRNRLGFRALASQPSSWGLLILTCALSGLVTWG